MTTTCPITELPPNTCAHCRNLPSLQDEVAAERERLVLGRSDPRWFTAQYPGTCAICGEPFKSGAAILLEHPGAWRAECCAGGR